MFEINSTFKVDHKGRVALPAPYRDSLAEQSIEDFELWLAPSIYRGAKFIEGYGRSYYQKMQKALRKLNPMSPEYHALSSVTIGAATKLKMDGQSRVLLPKMLINRAGLEGEAYFVGLEQKFQIWSPAIYSNHLEEMLEAAGTHAHLLPWGDEDEDGDKS